MQRISLIAKLVQNGEKAKINTILDNIYNENECRAYSVALEKIILIETAKTLNDSVAGFYIDTDNLTMAMFSDNPPTRKTVLDSFRDILCDAECKSKELSFEKAVHYIKRNLADSQLSVSSVAEFVGVTEKELGRLFYDHADKTPAEYIRHCRVEKSLSFLADGESVETAAKKSGFSGVETYIRAFKKEKGTTPGLWKRNKLLL